MKKVLSLLLAVVLLFSLSVTAFAADSPIADENVVVTIINGPDAKAEKHTVKKGEEVEFKADAEQGKFDSWSVYKADGKAAKEGTDYVIKSGKLTSDTIKIAANVDLIVCGNYDGTKTDPIKGGVADDKAPQTNDFTVVYLSFVMLIALAGVCTVKKQINK